MDEECDCYGCVTMRKPCINEVFSKKKLNKAEEAEYKFLKREGDKWADELNRLDAHPNVVTNLWVARKELSKFTSKKRKEGVNI